MKTSREKVAEDLFRRRKRRLINHFGRRPLDDAEIDNYGRQAFGARWGGVGLQSEVVLRPGRLYVVNTAYSPKSPGVHWVAVAVGRTGIPYAFDSYARKGNHLLHVLRGRHGNNTSGDKILDSDRADAEQRGDSAICGHSALAWLEVVVELGIRAAILV